MLGFNTPLIKAISFSPHHKSSEVSPVLGQLPIILYSLVMKETGTFQKAVFPGSISGGRSVNCWRLNSEAPAMVSDDTVWGHSMVFVLQRGKRRCPRQC